MQQERVINKCDSKGVQFKIKDLSAEPYQFKFLLERILHVVPDSPFVTDQHRIQEFFPITCTYFFFFQY